MFGAADRARGAADTTRWIFLPGPATRIGLAAMALAGLACGHTAVQIDPARIPRSPGPAHQLAGSWDLVERTDDGEGDEIAESHELHLELRDDGRVVGVWHRARSWRSRAGRFRCSGSAFASVRGRALLRGQLVADGAEVGISPVSVENACRAVLPWNRRCSLRRRASQLELRCGGRRMLLSRRSHPPLPLRLALGSPNQLTGVWTWHHRSVDGEGDLKLEQETWHLVQQGDRIEGYYDRTVSIRSLDGRHFVCNDRPAYDNVARFQVKGQRRGKRIRLTEVSYKTRPGQCEQGKRRLDSYDGVIRAGGVIQLNWGKGAQKLHRRY